jgi:hypothetical protein
LRALIIMVDGAHLQMLLGGAVIPRDRHRASVRELNYLRFRRKGETEVAILALVGSRILFSEQDVGEWHPELKIGTVRKVMRRLVRERKARKMVVLGITFWVGR